jgi:MFS transporter, DHA1 family, tetracycline resistance protein
MSRELASNIEIVPLAPKLALSERFACIAVSFVSMLGVGLVTPILPYFSNHFGVSTLWAGVLVGVFPFCEAAAAPFLGRLADGGFSRSGLSMAFLVAAISYLVFAFAQSFWVLLASRALAGAASGAVSIAQSYVGCRVLPAKRAGALGQFGAAQSFGFVTGLIIGAAAGASADGTPNYTYSFYIAAALAAVAAISAYLSLDELSRPADRSTFELPPGVLVPLFSFGVKSVVFIGLSTLVPYVLQMRYGYSVRVTSLVFLAVALGAGFVQGVCVPLVARIVDGQGGTILGFLLLCSGAGSGTLLTRDPAYFWLSLTAITAGYALLIPFQLSELTRRFGVERAGYGLGLAVVAASSGATLGPIVTGGLASDGSFVLAFAACAGLAFLTTVLLIGRRS